MLIIIKGRVVDLDEESAKARDGDKQHLVERALVRRRYGICCMDVGGILAFLGKVVWVRWLGKKKGKRRERERERMKFLFQCPCCSCFCFMKPQKGKPKAKKEEPKPKAKVEEAKPKDKVEEAKPKEKEESK